MPKRRRLSHKDNIATDPLVREVFHELVVVQGKSLTTTAIDTGYPAMTVIDGMTGRRNVKLALFRDIANYAGFDLVLVRRK